MGNSIIPDWLVGYGFLIIFGGFALFICIKHHYLVHYKFKAYMSRNHRNEWEKMMQETGWLPAPTWSNTYFTKAIYDFIWRTDINFEDPQIDILRKRIKFFIWELPLFCFAIIICFVCLVLLGY